MLLSSGDPSADDPVRAPEGLWVGEDWTHPVVVLSPGQPCSGREPRLLPGFQVVAPQSPPHPPSPHLTHWDM